MTSAPYRFAIPAVLAALVLAGPVVAQSSLKEIESPGAARHFEAPFQSHTFDLELLPAKDMMRRNEAEYSVLMKAGDVVVYSLTAPGAKVYQEFHGHTKEAVTFYRKHEAQAHAGQLAAPFDGLHGWYMVNNTDKPIKVQLKLSGFYTLVPPGDEGNEYAIEPTK